MDSQKLANELREMMYLLGKNKEMMPNKEKHFLRKHDMMFLKAIEKINDGNPVRMSDITHYFHISAPATSQMIRRYEQMELVKRMVLEHDRRSVYVQLTPYALAEIKKVEKRMNEDLIQLIRYLGEEDTKELLRILGKMIAYEIRKER